MSRGHEETILDEYTKKKYGKPWYEMSKSQKKRIGHELWQEGWFVNYKNI
jgi:hypothetical protein